ncbi:MAG: hypothetical protein WBL25_08760 [Anaerolineales bacterium]
MNETRYLPDSNRVGVLIAAVLLAFALTHLIQTPEFTLELQLPGFYFEYPLSLSTLMVLMAAGLTATGMDWLLRSHPSLGETRTIEHWLLPTLATFIVGIPLTILPPGNTWWVGFGIAGLLLVLIFLAEYIVVEPSAPNYAIATAGLTALSFAVYLILTTALRFSSVRLFLLAPALFVAAGLVSLRTLHLRVSQKWEYNWAVGIAFVCTQIGAGLHYWPISPVQFGLVSLGPLYAVSTLTGNLLEGIPLRRAMVEPLIALILVWGAAAFFR